MIEERHVHSCSGSCSSMARAVSEFIIAVSGLSTWRKQEIEGILPTYSFFCFCFHGLVLDQLRLAGQSTGQDPIGKMVYDHESQGKDKDHQGCHAIGAGTADENVQLFGI